MRSITSPICSADVTASSSPSGSSSREVEVALVAGVDDLGGGRVPTSRRADGLDRALRGRQPDALRRPLADRLEPLEREREVRAALVACDGVDLVDDDGLDRAEERRALSRW